MRHAYSLIRFVPDPARGEFINVGAIVGSEESSEWEVRQIENPVRARWLDEKGTLDAVWSFVDRIGRQIDEYEGSLSTLLEPSEELSERWLEELHNSHRNIVQLTPPTPIVAENATEALDRIFDLMLEDPARQTYPFAKKHRALAAARGAFRRYSLERGRNLFERVVVRAAENRERIDFAVTNGRVVQLTQTWSFQVPDQEALAEQIKAWGWTVRRIREEGGSLEVDSVHRLEIPKEVDIAVVYVPPDADQPTGAFEGATGVFEKVKATAVTDDAADEVAERAQKLLIG
jgi:hypothetical protein